MQCDLRFHFSCSGNGREAGDRVPGVARAADSPPPPPPLATAAPVRDGRLPGRTHVSPAFATKASGVLKVETISKCVAASLSGSILCARGAVSLWDAHLSKKSGPRRRD